MRVESQIVTTFEIRRNGYPYLRIEHDSKRHGPHELLVIFFAPDGEKAQRMTISELEKALRLRHRS